MNAAQTQQACTHPDDLPRALAEAEAGSRTGQPFSIRYRTVHPDKSVHHVIARARAVLDDSGKPIRLVGTNRDVTAEHELEQQRERFLADATAARAEADQQDRTKDQFLITLSHELRTPLASILLWARALRSGTVAAQDFGRATDAIVQSAESQLQLIEDLVDLSRLKSGCVQIDLQTTSVEDVARASLQMIGPTAEAKRSTSSSTSHPTSTEAMFDRGRYQQVLWNLLSNAVKFTSEGGRVSLRIRKDDNQLEAVVTDTGQGIDPDFLPQLFQRFRGPTCARSSVTAASASGSRSAATSSISTTGRWRAAARGTAAVRRSSCASPGSHRTRIPERKTSSPSRRPAR